MRQLNDELSVAAQLAHIEFTKQRENKQMKVKVSIYHRNIGYHTEICELSNESINQLIQDQQITKKYTLEIELLD